MSGDRYRPAATRRLSVTVEFEVVGDQSDDDLLEFLRGFVGSSTTGGIPHRHVQVVDVHRESDVREALNTLHTMWMRGMGTFRDSRVAAIWNDGTLVNLVSWGDVQRAFLILAGAHNWWDGMDVVAAREEDDRG